MGLFKDIGRAYDWVSEVAEVSVYVAKEVTPDLATIGAVVATATLGVAAAALLVGAFSEPEPHKKFSANTAGPKQKEKIQDDHVAYVQTQDVEAAPTARKGKEQHGPVVYVPPQHVEAVTAAPAVCVKSGCSNPRASAQFICWEHLYEAKAYELAMLRAQEELQAKENQRLASLCTWKACESQCVGDAPYCSYHKRENEQYRARRCGKKLRYPSFQDAEAEAQRMQRLDRKAFNVYMCNFCDNFHIGHAKSSRL